MPAEAQGQSLLTYVRPSAYIGRHGWNSVRLGGAVPYDEVLEMVMVNASYDEVVAELPGRSVPERSEPAGGPLCRYDQWTISAGEGER